jgi:beta-glucosidase
MLAYGEALGEEYLGKGINIALLPVAGPLGRTARGGRNWEGFGADHYLSGIGMGQVTKGLQSKGVIAQMKHWLLNEQEWRRLPRVDLGESVSTNADDRTIWEGYVWPFMDALREGCGSAMCSYQRVSGVPKMRWRGYYADCDGRSTIAMGARTANFSTAS